PRLMVGALIATFLFSYGLQVLIPSLNATNFVNGAVIGFVAWFTFSVSHSLNTQFEGRKPVVLLINNCCMYLHIHCLVVSSLSGNNLITVININSII
ncbi:MAG: DUF1761 domain-containing protein, partial [Clostridiaceae bacterium]|nr:DUF1761 domain-containing protein [Clostridiaceae bacterium]